jgi:poly-gamma-glutamate capsule biosynthesis protein CapA/YwtB (metallophosphatase superfamily)
MADSDAGVTVVVTGDSTVNMRLSLCREPGFVSLIEIIRSADVAFTHVEATMHDFAGPELYPAAEGGWIWMRSPRFAAEELRWAGFDIVSLAGNHSLDYSYGGLFATWDALAAAGLPHAGTGRNLAEARAPAFVETPKARVALVSMSSSFPAWARAGAQRHDFAGRPGLNPLRWFYAAGRDELATVKKVAKQFGWWVTASGPHVILNPPGTHNTIYRFIESDEPGIRMVADEDDVAGNLRSVTEAKQNADLVIVQLHNHEWDPVSNSIAVPPTFVQPFAHAAVDAGADVFVAQGSHAPLRGIEIYHGRPIFYDPGDFIKMSRTTARQPADFYMRPDYGATARAWNATFSEGQDAKEAAYNPINPPAAYSTKPGVVLARCHFAPSGMFDQLELVPVNFLSRPRSALGIPTVATGGAARAVLEHIQRLSKPFGTDIRIKGDRGLVTNDPVSVEKR